MLASVYPLGARACLLQARPGLPQAGSCGGSVGDHGLTKLVVRGARQHNLKNIKRRNPPQHLTVITGLSGSGIIPRFLTPLPEGQRRYVDPSPPTPASSRQIGAPEVDVIEGSPPHRH